MIVGNENLGSRESAKGCLDSIIRKQEANLEYLRVLREAIDFENISNEKDELLCRLFALESFRSAASLLGI